MRIIQLLFTIILCIYPLFATAEIRTITHNEEIVDSYGPDAQLRVFSARTYDDGTAVIRIIKRKARSNTASCSFEVLFLRIIHPNGTIVEKDIKLDIQQFNFCIFVNPNPLGIGNLIFLDYQLIRKNHILVTYFNATNPNNINDINTYQWGMIIDFDGNVFSRIPFGPAFIDQVSQAVIPNTLIQLNINREKGFLRFTTISNSKDAEWQQYKVETDGTITRLTSGIISFPSFTSASATAISTIDEGYAIAFTNTSASNFVPSDPLSPRGQLFVLIVGYNQTATSPLLLYQTSLPNLRLFSLYCDVTYAGIGQICTLTVKQIDPNGVLPDKIFNVRINFLSSGSVSSFAVHNPQLPDNNVNLTSSVWVVNRLTFGGYLMTNVFTNQTNQYMFGFLFDETTGNYTRWEFQEPEPTGLLEAYIILPHNNTLLLSQPDSDNYSWQFKVIDLPKFSANTDKGYSNVKVAGTSPEIQSSISPDIPKISIDYYSQVDLSNGKLSIYQLDGEKKYLRQSIPAGSCLLENDGKTVSAVVLGSTFSVSNGNYFIEVDNNFVKDRASKESLLGIKENVWKFTTQQKLDKLDPSTTGLLRLNANGTQAFGNLSQEQRNDFFDTLLKDLSYAVPIPLSRLSTSRKAQLDNNKQYLISVDIKDSKNENDISVMSIIKNIDIMIANRYQTPIGLIGQVTSSYLDSTYGFQPLPDLWENYKFKLLAVFLVVGLVFILFLFARRRNSKGNNIAILQLGLILFDLVMDILFVSNNASDIPVLYIPSVVFMTVPIGINTLLAFSIITQENTREKFYKWFSTHGKVSSGFTVLSGADIEALNILQSNLAGLSFFNAPFSDDAKSRIFWGACINIFTEDIPQVIIQILYRYYTVVYDIIPLLTLISSVLSLTTNIVSRIYQRVRNGGISRDTNDAGDLSKVNIDEKDLEEGDLHDENTSREISPQNDLGDVQKLNGSVEILDSDSNLGNGSNEN